MWFSEIISLLKKNHKELNVPKIKTRVIGSMGINVAAVLINRKLLEILPFVGQRLELRTHPDLVTAMMHHEYTPVEKSLLEMAHALVDFQNEDNPIEVQEK